MLPSVPAGLTSLYQVKQCLAHVLGRQVRSAAMTGQNPFERIMRQFLYGIVQGFGIPHQLPRGLQPLGFRIPPEMIASEQKSIPIQQTQAARSMARNGNDAKLLPEKTQLKSFKDSLRIGHGMGIRAMDDPLGAESLCISGRIRDVIFMRQKDVGQTASALEGIDQRFEISR